MNQICEMDANKIMSMALDSLSIEPLRESDVPFVVGIHLKSFPDFFLTFLGSRFLHELYIATLLDPSGITLIARREVGILGFVTGTAHPNGFYRRLLFYRWWRFAKACLLPALKHPSILPRLFRAFSMPTTATKSDGRGTLMSIAVLPDIQGGGIGQALIRGFLHEAVQRGLHQIDLTTDSDNNEAANRFYQRLGFVCERSFVTPEGRAMNEYVIDLSLRPKA